MSNGSNGLDEIDLEIIRELSKNSRIKYTELADKISRKKAFTRVGISRRAERLEKMGIIKKFTIEVDYEKLGKTLHVISFLNTEHQICKDFIKEIENNLHMKDDSVIWIFTVSGDYSLGIYGVWKDWREYGAWKSKLISTFKSIRSMNEIVIWDFYKKNGEITIPDHIKAAIDDLEVKNK